MIVLVSLIAESEESDGWETVQRKTKTHGSPSQRSLENLATIVKEHHKLTRSVSEPNATGLKNVRRSNPKSRNLKDTKVTDRKQGSGGANIPNGDIQIAVPNIKTDGKDSDKENQAVTSPANVKVSPNIKVSQNMKVSPNVKVSPNLTGIKAEVKKSESVVNKPPVIPKSTADTTSDKKTMQEKDSPPQKSKSLRDRKGSGKQGDVPKSVHKTGRKSPAAKEDSKPSASPGLSKKTKDIKFSSLLSDQAKRRSTENLRKSLEKVNETVEIVIADVDKALAGSDDETAERKLDDVRTVVAFVRSFVHINFILGN